MSRARAASARDSARVFPSSRVSAVANSSRRSSRMRLARSRMAPRAGGGVAAQPGKAAWAAAMARRTSSSVALGKAPMTSPGLAGLASGKVAPSEASTHSPAIQFLKSCIHTPYLSGGGLGVAGDLDAQSAHRILEVIEGSLNPLPTGPAHTEGRLQRLRRGLDLAHPLTAGGLADVDLGPGPVEIPGQGMHLLRQRDGRQPICQVQAQRFELANLHLRPSSPFPATLWGWGEAGGAYSGVGIRL